MFTKFSNPLHQLAQNLQPERAHDQTENFHRTRKNILYTGLLASGLLLSGYNFVKDEFVRSTVSDKKTEETKMDDQETQTISVVSYVNFDTREMLHKNEPQKPVIVQTPHLNGRKIGGNNSDEGIIRGYLTDENGNCVVSADVLLYKGDELLAVTYTEANGAFMFTNIASDTYRLKILRAGFKELNYHAFEVLSNETSFLDICMESIALTENVAALKKSTKKIIEENRPKPRKNEDCDMKGLALTIIIKNPLPNR